MKLKTLQPRIPTLNICRVKTLPPPSRRPGYRIKGRKAVALRSAFLATSPLCAICLKRGDVSVGTEVDHIVPLSQGGDNTIENLQALCVACHRKKTAGELKSR